MSLRAIEITSREELERAWAIRFEVFVDEQKVPAEIEIDDIDTDPTTTHVLIVDGDTDVATGRLLVDAEGHLHIGRVAVRKAARGTGAGKLVMNSLAKLACEKFGHDGSVSIEISAQEQAMPFYENLGYTVKDGRRYLDAGIMHQDMVLTVEPRMWRSLDVD